MFDLDQPKIAKYGRANCDNFAAVLRFVVITIQNRLHNCPADCETVNEVLTGQAGDDIEREAAGILYGSKRAAVDYIESEKAALYWQAEEIAYHAESEREAAQNLIALFCNIPGIGMVKSGFICQLLYSCGGCLDRHNIERFDIKPARIKSCRYKNAKRAATRRAIISEYLDLCEAAGGCRALWNSWCRFLSDRPDMTGFRMNGNKPLYDSPEHVSALHCAALGLA